MSGTVAVTGDQLLEVADSCWNERLGTYHGGFFNGYNFSVGAAMRQDVKENGKNGRKRKARREEAVHIINTMFDHTRKQAATRLAAIASAASAPRATAAAGEMSELEAFASEVMELLGTHDAAMGSGLAGMIDISFFVTLITTIINAIQACKKPLPAPAPAPVPAP